MQNVGLQAAGPRNPGSPDRHPEAPLTASAEPLDEPTALIVTHPWFQGEGNMGALIIRIGFWGPLYYTYNKEPLK